MGPKNRKSVSLLNSCETCRCIISAKDLEVHNEECSLPTQCKNHCFISDGIFYARVQEIKASEIEENIRSYKNDLIFISQNIMQVCNFLIGDPVVITTKSKIFVKKAWPKNDGLLMSAKIYNSGLPDFDQNMLKEMIKISNLTESPIPAKEVHFKMKNRIMNLEPLFDILQRSYVMKILNNNTTLSVPFYGQNIEIEITKIIPMSVDCTSNFDQLSLEEKFYLILHSTVWKSIGTKELISEIDKRCDLKSVGGYKSIIANLKQEIDVSLMCSTNKTLDEQKFCGILLYGYNGTGKTLIAEALANDSGYNVYKLKAGDLTSNRLSGENLKKISDAFNQAYSNEPCILLLDNIDSLANSSWDGEDRKTLAVLTRGFDSLKYKRVVLIATALSPENIHPSLRRPGRLENEVEIDVPTEEDRRDILLKYFPDIALSQAVYETASVTHGYVGADLAAVAAQARSHATATNANVSPSDLAWATKKVTPSAMRQAQLLINKVNWEDIGGQEDLKLKIRQAVEWPLLHPETFARLGISPPRGILMFGPPGCSKTMIAKAIATESNLNFLSVKGSDIFSKWVGESERSVRELFGRARRVAPAIIFLDEVDAICPARDGSTHGGGSAVQDRVLSQLLTEMDGVQPLNNVIIIAATNRPDRIDKAFLRPGRLDRLIYVPLPDFQTRLKILKVKTKDTPLSSCVDISELAQNTEGYSGAEVVAVCNEAAMKALEEDMDSTCIRMSHYIESIKQLSPRTPPSLLKMYEEYVNKSNMK